jgi:hypothetical protein
MITRAQAGLPPLPALPRVEAHPGLVVHCTGSTNRPTDVARGLARVRIIQHSHTVGNGWAYGGYHFVVLPGGEIVELRGAGVRGAHAKGYNRWLGVCVLGRGTDITPAEQAAIESLAEGRPVIPHNAVSRKSCPGPAVTAWLAERFPR